MIGLRKCGMCASPLSPWEPDPCPCANHGQPGTNGEVAYAVAAASTTPLHLRDFVRLADVDYARCMRQATANATISPDPRFCWAGKGLYGLFRHGPLPGPRNLEESARLLLGASDRALTLEAIEFCLKKLHYRFTSASLYNAIGRSPVIEWHWHDGHFRVPGSALAQRKLLRDIPVTPFERQDEWPRLREHVAALVDQAVAERNNRLRDATTRTVANYDWD